MRMSIETTGHWLQRVLNSMRGDIFNSIDAPQDELRTELNADGYAG
jgi:hypothetical protein